MGRSYDAGQEVYTRYASLVDADRLPFVRASGSDRVIESASNWTAGTSIFTEMKSTSPLMVMGILLGFGAASNGVYVPALSVIISEKVRGSAIQYSVV